MAAILHVHILILCMLVQILTIQVCSLLLSEKANNWSTIHSRKKCSTFEDGILGDFNKKVALYWATLETNQWLSKV